MKHSTDILADAPPPRSRWRALLGHRAVWPIAALALILAVDGVISPGFFQIRIVEGRLFGNLVDILYRAAPTALVALGMAVVIGTKGIDLSVGSIIAIVGAVITWRIHAGDPHWLVLLIALAAGLACGLWNGFLVAVLDIQPIIATLILMTSGRGIGLMINLIYGGTNPSFTSPLLQGLSVGHIGLVPARLVLFAAIFAALWLLIRRTAFGSDARVGRQPIRRRRNWSASTRASSSTPPISSPASAPPGRAWSSPPTPTPPTPSASGSTSSSTRSSPW